jgi:hypothetical protein
VTGPYHIIMGRLGYVKFMAIPSYTYLKLEIARPDDFINVEAKAQQALDSKQDSIEMVTVATAELMEFYLDTQPPLADQVMPSMPGTIESAGSAKVARVDAEDPTKTVQVRAGLSPK